ncbi:hypothetical protein V6C53_20585 [Desulfocurvibacter africanus]|uniref:hypothetical protein n=1 Tax=Desulfocurvibacter africanus TaxID=873 RepID=UPI002FD9C8A8
MARLLLFEDGEVRLSDEQLPGVLKYLSIRNQVRFDTAEQDGMSGKTKTPLGWEDAAVVVIVELLTDSLSTCYDKLAVLDATFRGHDSKGNPLVLDVVNAHLAARGVDQVVFSGLDSSESDQDDVILVNLSFTEHRPAIVAVEERAEAGSTPAASSSQAEPELDTALLVDVS